MDWNSTPSQDQVNDRKSVDGVLAFEPTPPRPGMDLALAGVSGESHRFDPTLPQPLLGGRLGRITG
ncbi:MAG TPA: hypothetical protein VI141_04160 [Acidimicrobiia bacterium]